MVRCCLLGMLICLLCPRLCKAEGAFLARLHLALPSSVARLASVQELTPNRARPMLRLTRELSLRVQPSSLSPAPSVLGDDALQFDKRSALAELRKLGDVLLRLSGLAQPADDPTPKGARRTRAQVEPLLGFSRVGASVCGRF